MQNFNYADVLCWTARLWSVGTALFVAAFAFGGTENVGVRPTVTEWVGIAFFPIGLLAGLATAFRRELLGGAIGIGSLVGFYAWHLSVTGRLPHGPWFLILGAPAFLFVLSELLSRPESQRPHDAMQ